MTVASVSSSDGELLERVEDNIGPAEHKQESGAVGECFEEQRIEVLL